MPIIESRASWIVEHKNSFVIETCFSSSPEQLVFAKSICKVIEFKVKAMDGFDLLKLEVPEWLLSKMVKKYHFEDYKIEILI